MEANTKKVCKWCGKPEATEEGPCVPVDAFCWAAVNMDYCEEQDDDRLLARATKAEARVAELEAIVARLPETDDGVQVTPGMIVYAVGGAPLIDRTNGECRIGRIGSGDGWDYHALRQACGKLYSTPEAALAAKEKP